MMRAALLIAVLGVAGCNDSPASLGITGPGAPAPLPVIDDSVINGPTTPDTGVVYGPSIGPVQSSGRYFNYN
jgi:hypothetical protein